MSAAPQKKPKITHTVCEERKEPETASEPAEVSVTKPTTKPVVKEDEYEEDERVRVFYKKVWLDAVVVKGAKTHAKVKWAEKYLSSDVEKYAKEIELAKELKLKKRGMKFIAKKGTFRGQIHCEKEDIPWTFRGHSVE